MATRIPINKDNFDFEERQKSVWSDMEQDMEKRRREWEGEIEKMRGEFFQMNPERGAEFPGLERGPGGRLAALQGRGADFPSLSAGLGGGLDGNDGKAVIEKDELGNPMFQVRFNMNDYSPEEINVKMDTTKIMVSAKHEEKGGGSSVSREYNREVNIPRDVDPLALQCTLNADGFLVVHAPLPTPSYNALNDASSVSPSGVTKSSSSYSTSSSSSTLPKGVSINNGINANPMQQQQSVSQQPASFSQTSSSSNSSTTNRKEAAVEHPDHVTPAFKPPVDLSKFDNMMEEKAPMFPPPTFQASQQDKTPMFPPPFQTTQLHSVPAPLLSNTSSLHRGASPFGDTSSLAGSSLQRGASPFGTLSSNFSSNNGSLASAFPTNGSLSSAFPSNTSLGSAFPSGIDASFPSNGGLASAFPPVGPIGNTTQLSTPVVTSQDGKFQLTMPIDEFKPEELTVKTQDGKVVICAKRQVTTGNRNQTMEMSREHSLPGNVDPLTVKAFFTDTNNLIVEAPFLR